MSSPRVPVQIPRGPRLEAALRFAAGPAPGSAPAQALHFLCEQLSVALDAPVVSVYALEGGDLVLRANHGFDQSVVGEIRLAVGQGITGTAVETLRPVTVDDAAVTAQFAYFPQLAEERYPAFLAVPLLDGRKPRGALVLQREKGPFTDDDLLLAATATPLLTRQLAQAEALGATRVLQGKGNGRGRTLGLARVLSRVMPRGSEGPAAGDDLAPAFRAERDELTRLLDKARAELKAPVLALEELATLVDDTRLEERAHEHVARGLTPSVALERLAAEVARTLAAHGPASRRAMDVEAFLGAVAWRHAGLDIERARRGELVVLMHLAGPTALRAWSSGAVGACCADSDETTGLAIATALGLPVVTGVRNIFELVHSGDRLGLDAERGEVTVHPNAAQAASLKRE